MKTVRPAAEQLKNLEAYDPRYLPARIYLNANENPYGMPAKVRMALEQALANEEPLLHRYPDPLAKQLRAALAAKLGVKDECVLLGNGGDELLFALCLAYGGEGRTLLTTPPTFSVYDIDATLTRTQVLEIPRVNDISVEGLLDFRVDESAILDCVRGTGQWDMQEDAQNDTQESAQECAQDNAQESTQLNAQMRAQTSTQARSPQSKTTPDLIMLTSPNNPTGDCLSLSFIEELLNATDALVLIDQAYIEFAADGYNAMPLFEQHMNLAILRTFSKAYSLAGLRIGYLVAHEEVTQELRKVRQPYSVDSLSALAALAALAEEAEVDCQIESIVSERKRLAKALGQDGFGLPVAPSEANYLLVRMPAAHEVWQRLYNDYGILVRDLSLMPETRDCLRITIGTSEENDQLLNALTVILELSSPTEGVPSNE